jgi:ABC-type transporter Mla subunit MlaD
LWENGDVTAKKRPSASALLQAIEDFEAELVTYAQLSEAFQRAPLASTKQLERANETLGQIAASEQRLGACGQRLAQAVSEARDQQERLARATLERVPAVKQRMEDLRALLARFEALGQEAAALNATAGSLAKRSPDAENPAEKARQLTDQMHALSQRAQELTTAARDADFEELANRAHALHQQLLSGYNKLKLAFVG